jgi:hypothetical protein
MGHEVNLNFSGFLSVLASLLSVIVVRLYLGSDCRMFRLCNCLIVEMIVGCLDCFIVLELIVNFPVFIIKFFSFLKNIFYEFSGFYIKETGKKKKM